MCEKTVRFSRLGLYICIVALACAHNPNRGDAADRVWGDQYDTPKAQFIYSSSDSTKYQSKTFSRHTVCNKHREKPLIFTWVPPGFGASKSCPLPVHHCAVHEKDAYGDLYHVNAEISFIQDAADKHAVTALVDEGDTGHSTDWISTRFFGYFSGVPQCPEDTVEITSWVRADDDSKEVLIELVWNPPGITIAYGIDSGQYSREQIESMLNELKKPGSNVSEQPVDNVKLGSLAQLAENNVDTLLIFDTSEEQPNNIRFSHNIDAQLDTVNRPVFVIRGGEPVAGFLIATLEPSQ